MGGPRKLTQTQRALICEMARDRRVILMERHPRLWSGIRYYINAFPRRSIRTVTVTFLAMNGYLALGRRGYYEVTNKAMLIASLAERRRQK